MVSILDEENAGKYIGGDQSPISPRTLQRWRVTGEGPPFVKIGRAVRYREDDLEKFIAERRRSSTSTRSAA
jgi:predicted site-specific integrase-resolvase